MRLRGLVVTLLIFAAVALPGAVAQGRGEDARVRSSPLSAKEPELVKETQPLIDLSRVAWRFHPGDEAVWADGGYDDSDWPLLAGNKSWDTQGYKGLGGFAWYRIRVKVPPGKALAFGPGHVFDNYDVFVNGRKLATWGNMAMGAQPLYGESAWSLVVPIPGEVVGPSGELVIALRLYHWPNWAPFHAGGFGAVPKLLGAPAAVEVRADLEKSSDFMRWLPALVVYFVMFLSGVLSLLLYLKERRSTEYLWFGISQTVYGVAEYWIFTTRHWIPVPDGLRDGLAELLFSMGRITSVIFLFRFIGKPIRSWARWLLLAQFAIVPLDVFADSTYILPAAFITTMMGIDTALLNGTILWLIFNNWRSSRAARRLALPMIVIAMANLYEFGNQILYTASLTPGYSVGLFLHPFQLSWDSFAYIIYLCGMAFVMTERFAETQREKSRLVGEFEAARTIQQVLIPDQLREVPGLTVESAYLPAQEVGGDFFQVLPLQGGAAFVVVGDVSGKGLKAAMTVSLIVGTLRTYAEFYTSPAELLAGLNRRLVGRGDGFTTCLVMLVEASGEVTIANAGHLNPYLAGTEIETTPGIPLGLMAEVEYEETRLHLAAHQQLTLVTDGVVEAAHAGTRELFGFTRTALVSTHSAQSIAEEAQLFGQGAAQGDDITVLTLVRGVMA